MNYTNLWDKFFDVKEFWNENKKLLEDFSNIIKEKSELDKIYGKGLEKLSKYPIFDKAFGTSSPIFQGFRNFYSETSSQILNHADFLQSEIYAKLKKLITSHESSIQEFKNLGKKIVLEREKLVKNHLKSRDKYWKASKENEQLSRPNPKSALVEESCQKAYISSINSLNTFNQSFQENISKVLLVYEDQNMEKFQLLKQSLQVFIANEAGIVYSMKMLIDHLPVALETFNPEVDQRMFVDSNYTGRKLEIESFLNCPEASPDQVPSENELEKIINSCWEGLSLTEDILKFFESTISKDEEKKNFISLLNDKRKNGLFKIPSASFHDLGKLLNRALNKFNELEYLSLAKQCIILSQTFFKLDEENEKIFLQTLVMNHKLWQKEDYWEYMVENAVDCALDALNEFGDEVDSENQEDKKKSVISSAIISYTHMMASFGVDSMKIIKILESSKEKYKLLDGDLPVNDIISSFN